MTAHDPEFLAWVERARAGSMARAMELCGFEPAKGMDKGVERAGPCPVCGGRDRFAVNLKKRRWLCRVCATGGSDALSLAMHGGRVDFISAVEALSGEARPRYGKGRDAATLQRDREAREAGYAAGLEGQHCEAAMAGQGWPESLFRDGFERGERERGRLDAIERERERNIDRARALLDEGRHDGAAIAAYFAARGLRFDPPPWLRWHRDLPYWHDGAVIHRGPALLAPMTDEAGRVTGVHRTWVDLAAPPKFRPRLAGADGAPLATKKMAGEVRGTMIRLTMPCDALMVAGEGMETAVAGMLAAYRAGYKSVGAVAAGSLGALKALPLARFGGCRHLIILGDGDSSQKANLLPVLREAGLRAKTAGIEHVRIAVSPRGKDFADLVGRAA